MARLHPRECTATSGEQQTMRSFWKLERQSDYPRAVSCNTQISHILVPMTNTHTHCFLQTGTGPYTEPPRETDAGNGHCDSARKEAPGALSRPQQLDLMSSSCPGRPWGATGVPRDLAAATHWVQMGVSRSSLPCGHRE